MDHKAIEQDRHNRTHEIRKSQDLAAVRLKENEDLCPFFEKFQGFPINENARLLVAVNHGFILFRTLAGHEQYNHYLAVRKVGTLYEIFTYDGGILPNVVKIDKVSEENVINAIEIILNNLRSQCSP